MRKVIASSVLLVSIVSACAVEKEKSSSDSVKEIVVQGSKKLANDDVLKIVKTKVGDKFSKNKWDADWWRLRKSPLLQAVYSGVYGGAPGGVVLWLYVVDAPSISSVSFENEIRIPRELLHCMQGGPYSEISMGQDIKALSKENKGREIVVERCVEKYETHVIGRIPKDYPSTVGIVFRFKKAPPRSE